MTYNKNRDPKPLSDLHQHIGRLSYLGNTAWGRANLLRKHGLYRVNDGHLRLQPFHHLTDGIQIRLTQKLHFVIKGTDPIGPQTNLS